MLLASVAARTSRIKLGATSYLLPIRHPLQAAEEVAVLDQLSLGRLILGVGRGAHAPMFQAFNIDSKEKRKLFKTNLDAMFAAWRGDPILQVSDTHRVSDTHHLTLDPRPFQSPYPPVWVAAFGPLAIKQAGSLGLPYLASPVETIDKLIDNYQSHGRHANERGHPPIVTVPVMRTLFASESRSELMGVRNSLRATAAHTMRDEAAEIDDWTIVGEPGYIEDRLADYVEKLGMTHLIARGRLPGVTNEAQLKSHELLAKIVL